METSDHILCVITITTDTPRGKVYMFDNYLMEHEHCLQVVQHGWSLPTFQTNKAKNLTAKFKNLRVRKGWQLGTVVL